jgi:tellurite resistance protein
MPVLSIIVSVVLVLVLAIGWALLSFKFQRTPEKQWKDRVATAFALAQQRCAELSLAPAQWEQQWQDERRTLPDQHYAQMLTGTSIDDLENFPGIGPATIARLRQAGHTNIGQLQQADLHAINGLNNQRLADVEQARKALLQQLRERFDKGACAEAQSLATTLAQRQRDLDRQKHVAGLRLRAAERIRIELQSLANQAALVNFATFLMNRGGPLLPPVLLQSPLPDLEAALAAAEKEALPSPPSSAAPAALAPAPSTANQDQQLLELTIQFAYVVARCDGHLAKKEKEWIAHHLAQRYRQDANLLERARALCTHYETVVPDADACLDAVGSRFSTEQKVELMELAHGIAAAAGAINQKEVKFLHKLSQRLGVPEVVTRSPSTTQPVVAEPPPPVAAAPPPQPAPAPPPPVAPALPPPQPATVAGPEQQLALLEIAAGTPLSADLIRRQYTRLVEKFAPDKMHSMGPEFVAVAQQKRQLIEQAARALMAPFKEELVPPATPPPPKDLRHNPDLDSLFGG